MWTRSIAVVSFVMLLAGSGRTAAKAPVSVPATDQSVAHALNRLTFGARPGDVERVRAIGLQRWIDEQLAPARVADAALASRLERLATLKLDSKTIQQEYSGPAMVERRQRQLAGNREPGGANPEMAPGGARRPEPGARQTSEVLRKDRQVISDIEEAKLLRAVYSERQLEEVLVDFWFNHFNVFAGKGATRNYLTEYEREAIRSYVLGNFRDLLGATAKSPAMLFYLDNWMSTADSPSSEPQMTRQRRSPGPQMTPITQIERPQSRARGLNENYARELLELHTLGVDGGYTQVDVIHVARSFTGWTIRPRQGSGLMFVSALHDRGAKTVLGHTIKAGGGIEDGEQVLDILAAHPSTARYIALKLATRFVSDAPPQELVQRAAARFTATKGDLREVVRTIVTSPEFFAPEAYRAKVKTPLEFVASALRSTGAEVRNALPLARELREMGMPLYFCQPPTGYDDTASTWVSAGALVSRMNFAVALGKNEVRGVSLPRAKDDLALEIGSPEFQRR
ncbi:MAG: DUF1800 domain-containing protein [Acidobacteriota bacterium]|nr:DUF1800 domain-containing protein [Acidobacteriota bacterium]